MESFDGAVGARTETLGRVVSVLERAGVEFLNDGQLSTLDEYVRHISSVSPSCVPGA